MDSILAGLVLGAKAQLKTAGEAITAGKLVGLINGSVYNVTAEYVTVGTSVSTRSTSSYIVVSALVSTDKAIVAVQNDADTTGIAFTVSVSGTTVTSGTPMTFTSNFVYELSISKIDTDKAIVCYKDGSNSDYGTACVLTASGTTITAGTPVVFNAGTTSGTSTCQLATDKALVTYRDVSNSGYGTACVLSVSGTVITAGAEAVFESATIYISSVTQLATDKVIVTYNDNGNSNYGTSCAMTVSGTTITAGTPVVFNAGTTYSFISICKINTDKALVCYNDDSNSQYGTCCVLSVSGTTITAGSETVFENAQTQYISVIDIDTDKAIVTYIDAGNSSKITSCPLSVSGTTVTTGSPTLISGIDTGTYNQAVRLTTDKILVNFRNTQQSGYTYGVVVTRSNQVIATGYAPIASMVDGDGTSKVQYIAF